MNFNNYNFSGKCQLNELKENCVVCAVYQLYSYTLQNIAKHCKALQNQLYSYTLHNNAVQLRLGRILAACNCEQEKGGGEDPIRPS